MSHTPTKPFAHTSGPRTAKIALVGEAWGDQEEIVGQPFIGASGQELTRMLREAGIARSDCFLTNVLPLRPPNNNIEFLCAKKAEVGVGYPFPELAGKGKYLKLEYLPELDRLMVELQEVNPNVVLALGNTACWALLRSAGISSKRGVTAPCVLFNRADGTPFKILPTYHPAAVMRNWALRPVVVADLLKAKRTAATPDISRPQRRVTVNPTMGAIEKWATHAPPNRLSVDIETVARQIEMIGFARSRDDALVIPFIDMTKPGKNYWPDLESEIAAWGWVKYLLSLPVPKIFQNGLYDLQYILKMGITPVQCTEDTMLMHHAIFPEMQKGLGFLGSVYTDEASWKLMRQHGDALKRDE